MNVSRAVLRTSKLKTFKTIRDVSNHNNRSSKSKNVKVNLPKHLKDAVIIGTKTPFNDVQRYLHSKDISKFRKNGVIAIEIVLSSSPEYFFEQNGEGTRIINQHKLKNWHEASVGWLKETFGENCVNAISHYHSESTPHIHAIVVPIVRRTNKAGVTLNKLNAAGLIGSPSLLSSLQTSYAKALSHLNIQRGIKGSTATHTDLKYFHETVNMMKDFIEKNLPKRFTQARPNGLFMIEAFKFLRQKLQSQESEIEQLEEDNQELARISNHLLNSTRFSNENVIRRRAPSR
ncbi:MAG: hypothetical protein CL579_00160 [Alteromonadaceae bacterium]|nr:hypothetical protein [Alteromonadaceae bacterium]MBB17889.1 hypothetical protein [Rickettsiales bacterium]